MSETQKIICPNCKTAISVDDVLHTQIESRIREQYEAEKRKDKTAIEAKEVELRKKSESLESAQKNVNKVIADAISEKMTELTKKEEEVERTKRDMEALIKNTVNEKIFLREKEIEKQAKIDADNEKKSEIESLKSREKSLSEKLTIARNEQVQLMDEKKKLQDEKDAFEIEKRKQLEAERATIKEEADKKASEAYQTILAQKEKALTDALRANEDMKRKIEQGSQQSQGEVAELNLEEELGKTFIYDAIEPVPKGIREYRLYFQGDQGWQGEDVLSLQHLRSSGMLP